MPSPRAVYHNGAFVPEHEARVSIYDSALMFGDMAFEVTRTYAHRPFRLRAHMERLYASLRLLEIDCGLDIDAMEAATHEALARNLPSEAPDVDWQITHDVSRGPLACYRSAFGGTPRPTVVIACWPLITHLGAFARRYEHGVQAMIPSQPGMAAHLLDPKAKTRSRLHYQLAQLQAQRLGPDAWPLLLDPDGFLAEGAGCNVFLVKSGTLLTPEPRNVLLGVSRATTIELASGLDIPVRPCNLGRYEALQADEIFCTSTPYCLVHAATFEGQPVGDGRPGPVFRRLVEAWKQLVGLDFVEQARGYAERMADWENEQARISTRDGA